MADKRISHVRGKGVLNHNNRNYIYRNVDQSRTKNNICYAKESLDEAYQKCFGQTLSDYNAKQKRADRKIDDYYTHLFGNSRKDVVATSSNKEKSFYEIVVQVGDKNTCPVGSADGELAAITSENNSSYFLWYVLQLIYGKNKSTQGQRKRNVYAEKTSSTIKAT